MTGGLDMSRILIVDDEPNVLNALRRELHGKYRVQTFDNPEAALAHCAEEQYDLALADYRMPGMDGIEFLRQFGKLQPDAARLVLSGQADFDAVADSINEAHVFRFIAKPWNAAELAATLAQALAQRAMLQENRRLAEQCRRERHWQRAQAPDKLYQVLVVDDEPNVLSAVSRDLTGRERFDDLHAALLHAEDPEAAMHHDFRFNVHAVSSPVQALERAEQTNFDVVIADYLMPEMDGLRFLEAFRQLQPDAMRILFTGFADKEMLVRAVNDSEIYGFIAKPWSSHELKGMVSQAVAYRNLLLENRHLAELMAS